MAKKIIWTERAQNERKSIFSYWNKRNKSTNYSLKLNQLFIDSIEFVSKYPKTGRPTLKENIRIKYVSYFALLYRESSEIYICFDHF